jgi:hypothetical protein
MYPIRATEDSRFANQLNRLEQFSQFISGIGTAIAAGNHDFESVWSISNRVYERHCSAKVKFMSNSAFDQSRNTALSA